MEKISEETEQKIGRLQLYEQSLQNLLMQKQQFQMQLIEVDSALKELDKTEKAYKIVGNLMVLSSKEDLKKELESKKETAELRVKMLEKQESDIKEKTNRLQSEVLKKIKNEKDRSSGKAD